MTASKAIIAVARETGIGQQLRAGSKAATRQPAASGAGGRVALEGAWTYLPGAHVIGVRIADGALDHLNGGQQRVDATGHDGLGGTAAAGDGNAAHAGVDSAQQQGLQAGREMGQEARW